MGGKCIVCDKETHSKCSRCCNVFYCSKDHQRDHWKKHKENCFPIQVKEDNTFGRYLVATKDIKEGEIIFKEKPLVIGPAQTTPPVCLGCYKILTEKTSSPCSKCGWPVCGENCEKSPNHKAECDLTVARGQKVNIQTFECIHPNYQCILVTRCLYLKKSKPDVWKTLMKLESHCDERKSTPKWKSDLVQVAKFIRTFFKAEELFTDEEIMKVCGVIHVNGHEVPFSEPPFVAIYNMPSMLEHNCRANCSKSFTSHGQVLIAAAQNIKAGDHLSICYTDPLWGTANRRHYLRETKFFNCSCERCKDVTELGTMFDALKCKNGCSGYLLPRTFITDESDVNVENGNGHENAGHWYCNTCDNFMTDEAADRLLKHIGTDLNAMKKGDAELCQRFLSHYGNYLHPSHYYMIDVKLALAQILGQNVEGGLTIISDEDLHLKIQLCKEIVDFLEKIAPAEIRGRGMLLYEMHAAIAENGRRYATKSGEGPSALIDYILESKKTLEKSLAILQNEPPELPEGKVLKQGQINLENMEKLLQNLYSSISSPV